MRHHRGRVRCGGDRLSELIKLTLPEAITPETKINSPEKMNPTEIPSPVQKALAAIGLRDDDPSIRGMVLCTTYLVDSRGWLHRTLVPVTDESHHYPVNQAQVLVAARLTGRAEAYRDNVASIVSFDSDECQTPDVLMNSTGLDFYGAEAVTRGAPDFAVLHRRCKVWVHGLGWAQSTSQWRAFVSASPQIETMIDSDATQV